MLHSNTMRVRALAALFGPLLLIAGCSGAPDDGSTAPSGGPSPEGVRILLIGLDGADWQVLDPLIASGGAPALASLRDRGAWGVLRSEEPMLSPILWTTLATGREPLEHGVLDFIESDPASGDPMPVSAARRRVPALWDLYDAAGLESAVVGWWASWPAYPLRGRIVSDRVAYSTYRVAEPDLGGAALFYPPDLATSLGGRFVRPRDVGAGRLAGLATIPASRLEASDRHLEADGSPFEDPVSHLRQIVASALTYHEMTVALLEDHQPDLLAVYYQGIDEVAHLLAHCRNPPLPSCPPEDREAFRGTLDAYYRFQDGLIADLLDRIDPGTAVVVASDHGFRTGPDRPADLSPGLEEGRASRWHRPEGIWMLAGPPVRPGRIRPHDLVDVAPTVLYLAGLAIPPDLAGAPATDAIRPGRLQAHPPLSGEPAGAWSPPLAGPSHPDGATDREALERLQALGYLGGGVAGSGAAGEAARTAEVRRLITEAFLFSRQGDLPEARRRLRRALDLQPGHPPARAALADVYRREGRLEDALTLYREVLPDLASVDPRLYLQAADAFVAAGRTAEAVVLLRGEAVRHPDSPELLVALARALRAGGQPGAAEGVARQALDSRPADVNAMALLFELLIESGRTMEAVGPLDRALAADPGSVPHLQWRGRIEEASGRLEEAAAYYARAIEAGPDRVEPRLDQARLRSRQGRDTEAEAVYREAARDFPGDSRPWLALAGLLEARGDAAGAIEALRSAEAAELDDAELYGRLGRLEAAAGQDVEARRHLRRSLELDPGQPEVARELRALGDG